MEGSFDGEVCFDNEEIAVTKIKMDPNYFFRYANKHSICQSEVGPFLGPTKALISNKYEICCLLLDQFNSVLLSQILI